MFGNRFTLFRLMGFEIRADTSWLLILTFIVWSLATGGFPHFYPDLPVRAYWSMALVAAFGLFASIILHEMAHSLVARAYGIPIKGITLFLFGGVAEMEEEPPSPKSEFLMALAGPAMSGVLAVLFWLAAAAAQGAGFDPATVGVARFLATINGILAVFNLVPGFPLDGGRALRAVLWHVWGDLRRATAVAARGGGLFGGFLIAWGVVKVLLGDLFGGLWLALIGFFLRSAAHANYQHMLTRQVMEGEVVGRFMTRDPVAVPPDISLAEMVEDYVYPFHHDFFPVVAEGRLVGSVSTAQIRGVPRPGWPLVRVDQVMIGTSADNTIKADTPALEALRLMNRHDISRLMVAEGGRLTGLVTLKDLMAFVALKMELDGN